MQTCFYKNGAPTHCNNGHELTKDNSYIFSSGQISCKICRNEKQKLYRKQNPEIIADSKSRHRYGLTVSEREEMLIAQGNCCKICKRSDCDWGKGFQDTWHTDHVHGTKIVRGILCGRCNILVGQIEKDLTLSMEVINYLSKDYFCLT